MEEELHTLATQASDIHARIIRGTPSEFERARLLRDMQLLANGIRTQAGRARELSTLITTLGDEGPQHPGGRAA